MIKKIQAVLRFFLTILLIMQSRFVNADCPGTLTFVNSVNSSNLPASLSYSPDSKFLTAGFLAADKVTTYSVDQTTGALFGGADAPGDRANYGEYSPNGKFFATVSLALNRLAIYSVDQAGNLAFITNFGGLPETNGSNFLSFSPDSAFVSVSNQNSGLIAVYSIDQATGVPTLIGSFGGSPALTDPVSLSYSPDGKFLAVVYQGSNIVRIFLINNTTGALTQVVGSDEPTHSQPNFVRFSPDGKFLAVANKASNLLDIYSIDQASGLLTPVQSPSGLNTASCVSYAPTGEFAAIASDTVATARVFSVNTNTGFFTFLQNISTDSISQSIVYAPNGKFAALANETVNTIAAYTTTTTFDAMLNASATTICLGDSTNLTTVIAGGTAPYTVSFSDGFMLTGSSPLTRTVSPVATTTYTINSVTDANGCIVTNLPAPITITVNSSPSSATLTALPTAICSGGSSTLTTAIAGGTAPYTVSFSDGFTQVGSSPLTRTVSPTVTTTYSISSIMDANGCSLANVPASVVVTVGSLVQAVLAASATSICSGDSVILTLTITGDGPFDVTWSDGVVQTGVNSPVEHTVLPTINTKYSALVKSSQGCTVNSNSVGIIVTPLAQPVSARTVCSRPIVFIPPICSTATLVSVGQPQHGTAVIVGNQISYTPIPGFSGSDIFGYSVQDNQGKVGSSRIAISVAPIAFLTTVTVACDMPLTFSPDICGSNIVSLTVASQPSHGTATSDGTTTITYTPAPGYSGPDKFTYTIQDSAGGMSTAEITLSVCPVPGVITPVGTFSSLAAPSALDFNPLNTRTNRFAVITDELANKIQLYNIDTHDFSLSDTEDAPSGVKFFPGGRYVGVVNARSNTLAMYRFERGVAKSGRAESRSRLVKLGRFATLRNPQAIAVSPQRKNLFGSGDANLQADLPSFAAVANADSNAVTVFRLDKITGNLAKVGDFETQNRPVALAYSPDGKTLAVANANSNSLSLFSADLSTGELSRLGQIKTQREPVSIDYSPDGQFVAVANRAAQMVQVFMVDQVTSMLNKIQDLPINGNPLAVRYSPDNRFAAISVSSDLSQVNKLRSRIETYRVVRGALLNNIQLEEAQLPLDGTLEFLSQQPTGLGPRALGFTPDNSLLATGNYDSNSISVFNTNAAAFAAPTIIAVPCCKPVGFMVNAYGEGVKIVSTGKPKHGTASFIGLQVIYTPNEGFIGVDAFAYTVIDDLGNRSSSFIQVTVGGAFSATLTASPSIICSGCSSTLTTTVTGGVAPFTFVWSDGFVQTSDTRTVSRTVRPTVTTTYSVKVTDKNGLISAPVHVTVNVELRPESAIVRAIRNKYC